LKEVPKQPSRPSVQRGVCRVRVSGRNFIEAYNVAKDCTEWRTSLGK